MELTELTKKEYKIYERRESTTPSRDYRMFSEQYLEKPVVLGDEKMELTPTISFWRGLPTFDDF